MTSAVFRAEFLRALPVWPWLLASHLLSTIAGIAPPNLTGRSIYDQAAIRTDLLGSIASWSVGALSLFLIVRSLWQDSPNRRELFLATRPIPAGPLIKGKLAGFLILILLPFVLTEAAVFAGKGQPAWVTGTGTLQAAIIFLVLIGAAFPAVWCWTRRSQPYVGVPLAVGMIIATAALLNRTLSLRFADSSYLKERLVSQPIMLCGLIVFGGFIGGCAWLLRRRRSSWPVPVFGAAASVALITMASLARIEPRDGNRIKNPSLVHLILRNQEQGKGLATYVDIEPPPLETETGQDIVWSMASLTVNGHPAVPSPKLGIGDRLRKSTHEISWSKPIRQALRHYLGSQARLPDPPAKGATFPASTTIPGNYDPTRMLDLEVGLRGTIIDWQVVADLPVRDRSEARWGNSRWELQRSRLLGNQFSICLIETAPYLWLVDPPDGQLSDPRCDRHFLIRESDGETVQLREDFTRFPWRRVSLGLRQREIWISRNTTFQTRLLDEGIAWRQSPKNEFFVPDASYRLVVVRGIPSGSILMDWKNPSPIPMAGLWTPATGISTPLPPDPRASTAPEWLKLNPPPAKSAADETAQAWLDEFAARIGNALEPDTRVQLSTVLGRFTADHPELVIRKTKYLHPYASGERVVFWEAMREFLPRDYVREMTAANFEQEVYELAVDKGWQGDLIHMAAERTRMGFGWQVEDALFSSPKDVGFSQAEWRDFFHLYPTAGSFRALAGAALPREELEKDTDLLLEDFQGPLPDPYIAPIMDLALARGRSEAPRWLHDSIQRKLDLEPEFKPAVWVQSPVLRWFDFPAHMKTNDEIVAWFLAQEPDRFAFDAVSGKYHLR